MTGLDVLMFAPGMPFQGNTLDHAALGGSETAALCVARELAKLGLRVRVFSHGRPGEYDGVPYFPADQFGVYAQTVPHDVCIVQRTPDALGQRMASRLNLLWCHDLALGRQAARFRGTMWNVDRVMVLSEFMRAQYRDVYALPDDALWTTRNGVDLARVRTHIAPGAARDRKKLLFAARPERGLDVLLGAVFPALLAADPALRVCVCGYDNTVQEMRPFYQSIDERMRAFGDRVEWLGHLTKDQLYAHYLTGGVYVYPTPSPTSPAFAEVSCISVMEAQACGLPVVSSARGALPETLAPDAGTLVDVPAVVGEGTGARVNPDYVAPFVQAVLRYVRDDAAWEAASRAGLERAKALDWSGVAADWASEFERLIAANNDDPHRLAYHFIRHSDILAAKRVVANVDDEPARRIKAVLRDQWAFTDGGPDGYQAQYEKIGQTHAPDFDAETNQQRFAACVQYLRDKRDAVRILDYGCAHGCYTVGFSNQFPDRRVLGVDLDKHGIAWANRFRAERALYPDHLDFRVGGEDTDLATDAPFDLLFMGETMEHLPQPWTTVTKLERWVRPSGTVFLTVPYGPWEYLSANPLADGFYPHRAHVWEFDPHDLHDMFGHKPRFSVQTMPFTLEERTGEALGWHLVSYEADQTPVRPVDMDRKLRLQRPRQTVSAAVIAGAGAEDQMRWCLRSLVDVADEFVVADTGLSPEGRRIADSFRARVVPARDAVAHGFEAPRNDALGACAMDWVLWIDTDERLMDPERVPKYLRANIFNGYSIRQHHFACDTTFKPDLPVRLFRRAPQGGKTMRFFGMIHEHPELGLNEGPGLTVVLSDAAIAHTGYLTEAVRRRRFWRNWPLLQRDIAAYPDRLLQKHFICRDQLLLANYELQQNGMRVTDQVRQRCQTVVDTWRAHFRGKPGYMNADTLTYYSDANKILGQGFDFKFELAASRDYTVPPNGAGPQTFRFATMEDLEAELTWRAKDAAAPFVGTYW